ncbi:hypothetical protein AB0M92_19265 [Streptomyces sp. NPDC051582]|uniref:hypothetical protein n=1 Tax=Streptomyces sp. NPDC051582 TaxID=3155167 RepID=UPI003419C35C
MAIELTGDRADELIRLQSASDVAHAEVLRLAEAYGPIAGWTQEQLSERDAAYAAWRDRAADAQAAVTEYAREIEKPRNDVEAAVKKAVRHPASEA